MDIVPIFLLSCNELLCNGGSIDDLVKTENGNYYVFKDENYWKLDTDTLRVEKGYPKKIREYWQGLPSNIDAAATYAGMYTASKKYFTTCLIME